MTRSRMKRTGSIASAGVLVSAGLFGAYVGNPRLQRAYASMPISCTPPASSSATVHDDTELRDALDDPFCTTITISGPVPITEGNLPTIDDTAWGKYAAGTTRDDSGLTIQGDGGGDDSIGGANSYSGIAIDVTDPDMEVTISSLTLDNFTSSSRGGSALFVKRSGGSGSLVVNLTDDTIADNSSTAFTGGGGGGAIHILGGGSTRTHVDIDNSTFTYNENTQPDGSGALSVKSEGDAARVTVYQSRFAHNDGLVGGAIRVFGDKTSVNQSYVYSSKTDFSHNNALQSGGAMLIDTGIAKIVKSIFDVNSAASSGGAVDARYGALGIYESTFTGNSVSGGSGGAIYTQGTLTVEHSMISGNQASTRGGGIVASYNTLGSDAATITYSTISGNTATVDGGGLYSNYLDTTIEYSSVVDNTASSRGGGIFAYASSLTLRNTYVGGNTSDDTGGGIYTYDNGTYPADLILLFSTVYDDTTLNSGPPAASEVFVQGSLYARGSAIGRPSSGYAMYARDGIDSVDSVSTHTVPQSPAILDDSVNFDDSVPPGGLFLTRDDTTIPGRTGARPSGNSPLVLRAADDSLGVLPLSLDQWQIARSNYDTYTIGARQFVTTPTPPDPPVPPGPPLDPPSEPRVVVAVAGDRRVTVSWTAPAYTGSGPVTGYLVTSSPGGKTCATVAPTVSCTVSGLDNGTTYTFTVRAQNDYGSSLPSAASNPVTPQADTPSPVPVPPVPAGGSSLLVDGQPTPGLRVDPNARQDGLDITGPGFTMTLAGLGPDGRPLPLADDSVLQVIPGAQADAGGTGFAAGSEVGIFLDPPPVVTSAVAGLVHRGLGVGAAAPISLGTLKVKADGTFAGTLPIPADLALGSHVLQAVGYSPTGQTRAVSIGILAIAAKTPTIVITGTRDGRTVHVKGATKNLTRTTVVPRYHFAGQTTYKTGVARPTIDASGNFTWSRKTGRTIYLYFASDGTRSNRLVLRRVG